MGENESFLAIIPVFLWGGGGGGFLEKEGWGHEDDGMNPKPIKILSLGAESYVIIITWKGFSTQSQVFVILSM